MEKSFLIPQDEIFMRISRLQKEMETRAIDGALIMQRVDLFYFTGTAQNGLLYVPVRGEPLLMVKRYYPRARSESPLSRIIEITSVREMPGLIMESYGGLPSIMGLEMDVIPVRELTFYKKLFPSLHMVNISESILKIRALKSDWEIRQLEQVAIRSKASFDFALECASANKTEIELASQVQTHARSMGHGARLRLRHHDERAIPWNILVLSIPDMDTPSAPYPTNRALKPPCLVRLDFKWVYKGYHLDEVRMLALGKISEELHRLWEALVEIHDHMVEQALPGRPIQELYVSTRNKAKALGYGDLFVGVTPQGCPRPDAPIGHCIGLELYEPPELRMGDRRILIPQMVLALRPTFILDHRFPISIGTVLMITETGNKLISKIPIELFHK
ncbi:MAG: hypothetical protein DRG76_00090 [Deltaproteobacteria bacterium]|nr:MAG: hypothetical protein DRG76_00090 [Deltaproteobacteria bacterium]